MCEKIYQCMQCGKRGNKEEVFSENGTHVCPPKPEEVCEWTVLTDHSEAYSQRISGCNQTFVEYIGEKAKYVFCPYCGKKIKVAK